ncbi:MAG TPA: hypothetical protein VN376_10020 [Longilinea sp.]|nr:hypothetical protein [Longilinea sp.]
MTSTQLDLKRTIWQALLVTEKEGDNPWFARIWIITLFLGGMLVWGIFFNWGNIPFDFHDWAEVTGPRMGVINSAINSGVFPLHASSASILKGYSDRLLIIPDVILTPQEFLLLIMPVGSFVLVDIWLLYGLGFWGLLRLRKKFKLGLIPFTLIFLLFNFNGHIVAHLSVGHFSWGSYFLLPWFFYLVFRFLDGESNWKWIAEMAGWMFLIVLQGGYHQFIWALMFLGLLGIIRWRKILTMPVVALASGLLSAVRLLPPVLAVADFKNAMSFIGGYPSLVDIISSFLMKQIPAIAILPYQNFSSPLGYWEFDVYIGFAGAAIFILGGMAFLWQEAHQRRYIALVFPMAVLTVLSIGKVYSFLSNLPIPLLSGERVTSRMFSMVVLCAMILATISIQKWLDKSRSKGITITAAVVGVCVTVKLGFDLIQHAIGWKVTAAANAFSVTPFIVSNTMVGNHSDPLYTAMIWIGLCISLAAGAGLHFLVRREKRKTN